MIIGLRRGYPELIIGYSDHTLPDPEMLVLTAAYLKGASVIEKHFTYDKSLPGNDHYHAMDVADLRRFCKNIDFVKGLEGSNFKAPLPSEEIARENARRSIVLSRKVNAGESLTEDNLTYKRPGNGISPLHWDEIVGMKTRHDLKEDHLLQWTDIVL